MNIRIEKYVLFHVSESYSIFIPCNSAFSFSVNGFTRDFEEFKLKQQKIENLKEKLNLSTYGDNQNKRYIYIYICIRNETHTFNG